MKSKTRLAFFWFGFDGRYGQWKDGLWSAMKILENEYDIRYYDINEQTLKDVVEFSPSVIFLWEAPICSQGKDAWAYNAIRELPNKKILLFAGGPLKKEWVSGFDLVCVESKINAEECEQLGIPYITAFGVNTEIMKPMSVEKKYVGVHHGTCASWKRQWLVGESVGKDGLIVGRFQDSDSFPFNRCKELGCTVLDEKTPEEVAVLLNESHICLQTSDYWGGGQRCTLEAMACGLPVICMEDSPKNREYVEESGAGLIVSPNAQDIKNAVNEILKWSKEDKERGVEYVKSKWTEKHYADSLKLAINKVKNA